MEVGLAAKDDGGRLREWDQRVVDLALQAVLQKEPAMENEVLERVSVGLKKDPKVAKVARVQLRKGRTHDRRAVVKKEAKGKRRVAREKPEHVGRVARQATLQRGVEREATKTCTPMNVGNSHNSSSKKTVK